MHSADSAKTSCEPPHPRWRAGQQLLNYTFPKQTGKRAIRAATKRTTPRRPADTTNPPRGLHTSTYQTEKCRALPHADPMTAWRMRADGVNARIRTQKCSTDHRRAPKDRHRAVN